MDSFLSGVSQMLKEDGTFLFADYRDSKNMGELHNLINRYFDIVKHEDIKNNVL
jgi:spermidine synthase